MLRHTLYNGDKPDIEIFNKMREAITGGRIIKVCMGEKHNSCRLSIVGPDGKKCILFVNPNYVSVGDGDVQDWTLRTEDVRILKEKKVPIPPEVNVYD